MRYRRRHTKERDWSVPRPGTGTHALPRRADVRAGRPDTALWPSQRRPCLRRVSWCAHALTQLAQASQPRVLSLAELRRLPDPSWRIDGVLQAHAVALPWAHPADGKTFLTLDMALSVATGLAAWASHQTRPSALHRRRRRDGMRARVEAWLSITASRTLTPCPSGLSPSLSTSSSSSISRCSNRSSATLPVVPVLIIIDPLAQCFIEGDENSATDMGRFMRSARRLQQATQAAIVIVHHTTKGKGRQEAREHGGGALRRAADAMIFVSKSGDTITITNAKQNDAEPFKPFKVRLTVVSIGTAGDGRSLTSCVLVPTANEDSDTDGADHAGADVRTPRVSPGAMRALHALIDEGNPHLKSGAWCAAIQPGAGQDFVSERSFYNWRKALVAAGLVEAVPNLAHHYRATEAGMTILRATTRA